MTHLIINHILVHGPTYEARLFDHLSMTHIYHDKNFEYLQYSFKKLQLQWFFIKYEQF